MAARETFSQIMLRFLTWRNPAIKVRYTRLYNLFPFLTRGRHTATFLRNFYRVCKRLHGMAESEEGLTIGQIGERVRRLARDSSRVGEHLRHLTKRGYLGEFIIRDEGGPGKHRLYHADAAYEAAVLVTLASPDLHPGQMQTLWLDDLVAVCHRKLPEWKAARRKGQTPLLYGISEFNPQRRENKTKIRAEPPDGKSAVTITINLTLIWQIVDEAGI